MKQKTRLLCFQRRRAIFTRVTTSVHLCLAAQTSTGTFIPYRYNRRNLSQPWYNIILRCASQKPSSTYSHPLSLSIQKLLCKTRNTCTLFVTVFTYIYHANIFRNICKVVFSHFFRMAIRFGITISPLNISDMFQTKSTFSVEPTSTNTTTSAAYTLTAFLPKRLRTFTSPK